jgi:pectinesterase
VRRNFTPEGKIESNLAPYADAMKAVAAEKNVPVVDLHRRSEELVEHLGREKSLHFGPPHPTLAGQIDGTHLSPEGAKAIAPLVAEELWNVEPALRPYLPSLGKPESAK